jgi:hypothetical protein
MCRRELGRASHLDPPCQYVVATALPREPVTRGTPCAEVRGCTASPVQASTTIPRGTGTLSGAPSWVPGRNETKTYGQGEAVRERKRKRTLPSKGLFGKVLDERSRLFNDLCMPFSPIELCFSGKLRDTTLDVRAERLTVGSSSFGKNTCLQVSEIERVPRYRRF